MTLPVYEKLSMRQAAFQEVMNRHVPVQDVACRVQVLIGSYLSRIHTNDCELFTTNVSGLSYQPGSLNSDLVAICDITTEGW